MPDQPDLLTLGELARWSNVTTAELRHYEALGLLDPAEPLSEPRRYTAAAVGLVDVIVLLHEVGFTPRETRELLDARAGSPRSWRQLTERKIAALDRQIAAARRARAALDHALGCEHDGIVDCPELRALVADEPGAARSRPERVVHDLDDASSLREPIEPPS
jgi:DNA-binding transcriptional MerR regulator